MAEELETGRIIDAYLKLRNVKQAYARAADAVIAEYDAKLDRLSAELLKRLNTQQVKSINSGGGIVVKQEEIIPTCGDWDTFYAWVGRTNNFEALEKRIKKTFIQEYREEHKGGLPPGVSVMRSYKAVVKKAPSKKGIPDAEE